MSRVDCPAVAPHAGARIETLRATRMRLASSVAPHAGARIETTSRSGKPSFWYVAPHAGARIETCRRSGPLGEPEVAPHAGARIETLSNPLLPRRAVSPLTRGRGSKHGEDTRIASRACRPSRGGADRNVTTRPPASTLHVAPHAGARIETCRSLISAPFERQSPLTRGRGSKHLVRFVLIPYRVSPLTRGRGSKRVLGRSS